MTRGRSRTTAASWKVMMLTPVADEATAVLFCRACRKLMLSKARPERCIYCSKMALELAFYVDEQGRTVAPARWES
jgi:hypothetical protein